MSVEERECVFVSSPYGEYDADENAKCYAKESTRHTMEMGYFPIMPDLYFAQFLSNHDKKDCDEFLSEVRQEWMRKFCSQLLVFVDCGVTDRMNADVEYAKSLGLDVHYVSLRI